jgi:two-component system, chemotaxis family, protein-glutamate methylesterase/glutaminase
VEFLAKPEPRISRSLETVKDDLLRKAHAVLNLRMDKVKSAIDLLSREPSARVVRKEDEAPRKHGPVKLVAIAASTGGPQALQAILTNLPGDLSAGIVIAQHMPAGFTRSFAERLNKLSALVVREAAAGDRVEPGTALIAPGGRHLTVIQGADGLEADIRPCAPDDKYIPSADDLLRSAAEACGSGVLGIVLTGMGRDGALGIAAIKERGGRCLAESEESAVIFGMPKEAVLTGAVDKVLPLDGMAGEILSRCRAQ